MSERQSLNICPLAALLAIAMSAAACDVTVNSTSGNYTAREEKRFAVTGKPELTLGTFDGPIEIKAWDLPEVVVEIEKRAGDKALADAILVKVDQSGNRIRVDVPKPAATDAAGRLRVGGGILFFGHVGSSARLTVSVPRECDVLARTGDGSITIEGVAGRLDLDTGDGSVRGSSLGGTLKVHTGDGRLQFRGVTGRVDLDTGDGGIEVAGVLAVVRAVTGDGSVTVRAEPGSAAAEAWEIRTGDGGVSLDLPDVLGADLDARTSDGTVRIDGLVVTGSVEAERDSVRGKLGAGGQTVRIRTGSGTITVRRY